MERPEGWPDAPEGKAQELIDDIIALCKEKYRGGVRRHGLGDEIKEKRRQLLVMKGPSSIKMWMPSALPWWTDQFLRDMDWLREAVQQENQRQWKKEGLQTRTPFEWMTYLTEEVGETADAISEAVYRGGSMVKIQKKAIQAATLALKIAEMAKAYE